MLSVTHNVDFTGWPKASPVQDRVRRLLVSIDYLFTFDRFHSTTPNQASITGIAKEPTTVIIGDIDGFEALMIPPNARSTATTKHATELMRIISTPILLADSTYNQSTEHELELGWRR